MKVLLDTDKCQGHNRCYALAPELFDVDDYGTAVLRVEGEIPAELELRVAIEEFIARFPAFALDGEVRWSVGQIRGPRVLPVRINELA